MTLRERTMENLRKRRENLINGNINSGHDDNVEALTDIADGNDVGTTN